jgi:hypothetical protein
MTRCLCTLTLCALFSLPIHAGSVEFAPWVPWKFISKELRKTDFSFQDKENALQLSLGELKPILKNVEAKMKGRLSDIIFSQGSLSIEADAALELRLGEISIDQFITREFGGNVFQVHIKASCASASLIVPTMTVNPVFAMNEGNNFFPELSDLHYSMSDWRLSPIHCEGISGVGPEIVAGLEEALNRPAVFSSFIRSWISPFLSDWLRSKWLLVRSSGGHWEDLTVSVADENGFLLKGKLPLSISDEVSLPEVPEKFQGEVPKFVLSNEGLQVLIRDRVSAILPKLYDLRENAAFRKLMASRLIQYFVWPDLRRFSSSTPFVLKNDPSSFTFALRHSGGQWNSDLAGQGSMVTMIGGSPIDYLYYKLSLSVPVKLELKNGQMEFVTGKAESKLTWNYAPLYQLLYRPDKKLPVNLLTSAINSFASNKRESVELPRFRFGEHDYYLGNFNQEDQLITMDWL